MLLPVSRNAQNQRGPKPLTVSPKPCKVIVKTPVTTIVQ
jgi:hypothetical protein